MARPYSSPWWNPALHREWRGARLTRREEGAYWVYCNRGLQAVRPNNAVRRDASPLECSGDFHHGLIGAHRRRVAMPRGWRRWPGIRCRPPHLHHEEQPRDHRVDRGDLVGLAAATATTRPVSPAGLGSPTRPARKRAAATAVEALARRSTPGAVPPAVEPGAEPTERPAVRPAGVRGRRSTSSAATAPYPPGAAAPSPPARARSENCRARQVDLAAPPRQTATGLSSTRAPELTEDRIFGRRDLTAAARFALSEPMTGSRASRVIAPGHVPLLRRPRRFSASVSSASVGIAIVFSPAPQPS